MISDQKPGVMGAISNIGQTAKQAVVSDVKKTIENSIEQISGKEKAEQAQASSEAAVAAQTAKEKENQAFIEAMYGPSKPLDEGQGSRGKGKAVDLKTQLGFGGKPDTSGTLGQQLGVSIEGAQNSANPLEQIGMGKSNTTSATASEQLNFTPAPPKTPEQQQQIATMKNQLQSEYYQKLTTPQTAPDTEERLKEKQEEQENAADRMARLGHEDDIEDQKKKEKQQPLSEEPNIEKNRGSSG